MPNHGHAWGEGELDAAVESFRGATRGLARAVIYGSEATEHVSLTGTLAVRLRAKGNTQFDCFPADGSVGEARVHRTVTEGDYNPGQIITEQFDYQHPLPVRDMLARVASGGQLHLELRTGVEDGIYRMAVVSMHEFDNMRISPVLPATTI